MATGFRKTPPWPSFGNFSRNTVYFLSGLSRCGLHRVLQLVFLEYSGVSSVSRADDWASMLPMGRPGGFLLEDKMCLGDTLTGTRRHDALCLERCFHGESYLLHVSGEVVRVIDSTGELPRRMTACEGENTGGNLVVGWPFTATD